MNICGLGKCTDLKLGEVSSLHVCISNKITIDLSTEWFSIFFYSLTVKMIYIKHPQKGTFRFIEMYEMKATIQTHFCFKQTMQPNAPPVIKYVIN